MLKIKRVIESSTDEGTTQDKINITGKGEYYYQKWYSITLSTMKIDSMACPRSLQYCLIL